MILAFVLAAGHSLHIPQLGKMLQLEHTRWTLVHRMVIKATPGTDIDGKEREAVWVKRAVKSQCQAINKLNHQNDPSVTARVRQSPAFIDSY